MHPGILSCPADATLTEVARMMVRIGILSPLDVAGVLAWGES